MTSTVALWLCVAAIGWLLFRDVMRRPTVSSGVWLVVLWVIINGSRSVTTWFNFAGEVMDADSYDSGNPVERMIYFVFMVAGAVVLHRRKLRLGEVARVNPWIFLFYAYWFLSVLWADSALIAFKRCFKDTGNLIMVLIVLTEANPVEAMKAVFLRCAFVLVPLSGLFIKYIPELGRSYHPWSGSLMYTGVATHKNTLGVLALVCGIFLLWDILDRLAAGRRRRLKDFAPEVAVLLVDVWLLFTSHSATSRFCFVLGAGLFLVLRTEFVRRRIELFTRVCVVSVAVFVALDTAFDLRERVTRVMLHMLDRDPTFTGRTDAWVVLVRQLDNPLLGAGFNSFWSGERMEKIWEEYAIIQAHNGYVETYLNGGVVGLVLLAGLLLAAGLNIKNALYRGHPTAPARFVFWLVTVVHNFSEASYCKLGLLWFVTMLVITERPWLARRIARRPAGRSLPGDMDTRRRPRQGRAVVVDVDAVPEAR